MAEVNLEIAASASIHLVCAFLAMEPPQVLISLARVCGDGSIAPAVQKFIWDHCLSKDGLKSHGPYMKSFLKKLIAEVEVEGIDVLDELYEHLALYMTSIKDVHLEKGDKRVLKQVSFIFPDDYYKSPIFEESRKLVVPLQCSVNMLEGDTGCSIWPASLYLSEFIISFPEIFSGKSCFEVGSGVGLVGICLAHVNASTVMLSDGDLSTLANLKLNLELNKHIIRTDSVRCIHVPWESANANDLKENRPDIILGADVIYNPECLPHLVRVLGCLLNREKSSSTVQSRPVAYIASVIRNIDTFNLFLVLVKEAKLSIEDITEKGSKPMNLLPYMHSYDRSSLRLFTITMDITSC
ncbi:putative uncharacterized protein DDB_G0277003 [Impatiens glandulifera]|uniref:putative uncharacterized protein DDB_G0277003 n=1 Tax=Impatiens glandulifera TaxID=253017 RepID=UPI001FB04E1D|nr:putative uncharacterized protein DDB_G0277003 [Impatiens glandulifera]